MKYSMSALLIMGLSAGCSFNSQQSLSGSPSDNSPGYEYATKTVYTPAASTINYQQPPAGYKLVFSQLLARHGSRGLSSPKYDDISMKIWHTARQQNQLTETGKALQAEIQRIMDANITMGYGNLSELGKREHTGIGRRLAERDYELFSHHSDKKILVEYSVKQRARDSGLAFIDGLVSANPALQQVISAPRANPETLYFHKQPQNHDYQEYKESDPQLLSTFDTLFYSQRMHNIARDVLSQIYTVEFIDELAAGKHSYRRQDETAFKVYNDVDAMIQLFNLYQIALGMPDEAGDTPWNFRQYFSPEQTQWLSYVMDAEDFYAKGPAFKGNDITYRMARPLVQDFFQRIEDVQQGESEYSLVARFAHAETLVPFTTYMQLPGSDQPVSADNIYTRANNPWRGAEVAPMGGNVQWDVFRNEQNRILVRMLYNEQEKPFKVSCRPIADNSFYYDFTELKRCYAM